MKICTKCGEAKPLDEYSRDRRKRDGLRSNCKACCAESRAAYYVTNRGRERARQVAMYAAAAERYRQGDRSVSGDLTEVGYRGAHQRVRWFYGPASSHTCEGRGCDRGAAGWALVNRDSEYVRWEVRPDGRSPEGPKKRMAYSLNPADYCALCHACHVSLDRGGDVLGSACEASGADLVLGTR